MSRYFLDYAAGAPLLPAVREGLAEFLARCGGNPSGIYAEGREVRERIDEVRERIADALGVLFGEVIFTSGGTEAAQLALLGVARAATSRRRILLGAGDHHCVLHQKVWLERLGFECDVIPIDRRGALDENGYREALGEDVLLVSLLHGQNETGYLADVARHAGWAKAVGALVLVDAVQTFPYADGQRWTVDELGADLLMVSGHKLGAPSGVGALAIEAGTPIEAVLLGGGQERDMRAGTENVLGVLGFGIALQAALSDTTRDERKRAQRDAFAAALEGFLPTLPPGTPRLAGHCHGRFPGVTADSFLIRADRAGIAASAGAACSSGSIEPSHVLLAGGWTEAEAREGLRFSFGGDDADPIAAAKIVNQVARAIQAGN
jgi:cysteine desulfurase